VSPKRLALLPLLLLLLLLSSDVGRAQGRGGASGLVMLLQSGRSRVVIQNALRHLETEPDNIEVLAALGVGEARAGYYGDALGTLSLSEHAELYADLGLEAHANALRATGDGAGAAMLRQQRQVSTMSGIQELRLWLYSADDLWSTGDLDGALALNLRGLSVYPRSGMLLAQRGELLLAQGDEAGGDAYLWLSEREGRQQRWLIAEGRRRLSLGDLIGARELAEAYDTLSQPSARFAAFRAEVLLACGDVDEAGYLLGFGRWLLSEDPDLLLLRWQVLQAQGDDRAAAALSTRLLALYSSNPAVQAALRAPSLER
jgi:hypothetical protein